MQNEIDAALAAHGMKTVVVGGGMSFIGWFSSSVGIALAGLIVAVCGYLTSAYFQWKRDRREQQEHEARMRGLAS